MALDDDPVTDVRIVRSDTAASTAMPGGFLTAGLEAVSEFIHGD